MDLGFFRRLVAPIALAVGLAGCVQEKPVVSQERYPVVVSGGVAQHVLPVFEGALGDAARFMKEKSLETFKEDAYLYLPQRQLLFDVGIIETSTSVYRQANVEEAILKFYHATGYDFHTHLDYHTKPVFDGVMRVFEKELRELGGRVSSCASYGLLVPNYFETCMPSRIDWERKQLEELNELRNYYERQGRVPVSEKVWLSYVPSDNDLQHNYHSPFRVPGQRAGIVIADYSHNPVIVWYDMRNIESARWYREKLGAFKLNREVLTRAKLHEIYSEADTHGISLRMESIPVFR